MTDLPVGFTLHCDECGLVVPVEAPRPAAGADCAFVARHNLAWFNAGLPSRLQHTQASATWELIHHEALRGESPDAECLEYLDQFKRRPEAHFSRSVAGNELLKLLPASTSE